MGELPSSESHHDDRQVASSRETVPLDMRSASLPAGQDGGASMNHQPLIQQTGNPLPKLDSLSATSSSLLPVFHVLSPSANPANPANRSPESAGLGLGLNLHTNIPQTLPETMQKTDGSADAIAMAIPVSIPIAMSTSTSGDAAAVTMSGSSLKSTLSAMSMASHHSLSPGSAISSPALAAMTDITPLPSPLLPGDTSPGPWKRGLASLRRSSVGSLSNLREDTQADDFTPATSTSPLVSRSSIKKKKAYPSLMSAAVEATHARKQDGANARHRSLSEFAPEHVHNVRPRNATVSSTPIAMETEVVANNCMHREEYLAEQRGLQVPTTAPAPGSSFPTPPSSNRSVTESEGDELSSEEPPPPFEYLPVRIGAHQRKINYRPVRPLGQGTFSKVVLATSEKLDPKYVLNEASEASLDPKQLVAIKIVEHGPAGGADEERVELSLKREVEILRTISHPSLVHLKAFDFNDQEALLVLGYSPGGDLFDLASQRRDLLTAPVVQRIFAELVDAVRYLHGKWIVHRDIKLENVLLNVPTPELSTILSPQSYPRPLVTLTDLGLSRKIPEPPASPLLTTRCGSEDYAAPEILLSQPYDGRATDGWALGVLLYALMEGRLPFDPPPPRAGARAARGRSRTAHRIARCEWMWWRFGDEDGAWRESHEHQAWNGARLVVEGLLKKVSRGRWTLDEVATKDWVASGIQTPAGLKREDENAMDVDLGVGR